MATPVTTVATMTIDRSRVLGDGEHGQQHREQGHRAPAERHLDHEREPQHDQRRAVAHQERDGRHHQAQEERPVARVADHVL